MKIKKDNKPIGQDELVSELQEFAKLSSPYFKAMNKRIREDLQYVAGDMYSKEEKEYRGERPDPSLMILNDYCDQVINSYSQSPFGIGLSAKTMSAMDSVKKVTSVLNGIQSTSDAKAVFTNAIDRQTKAGRGYSVVTTDYMDGKGFDQEIRIEAVYNPEMVIWDRFDKSINGRKATECALVEHMSCSRAEDLFGDAEDWDDMSNPLEDTIWDAPEESVALVTHYKLIKTKSKIWQLEDGSTIEKDPKNNSLKSRMTSKTVCRVVKIIGDKVVGNTTLPIKFLPVVPFLGQMIDKDKKNDWVGLVHYGRAPTMMLNWAAGEMLARLAKAPKSLIAVDGRSVINYKEQMDNIDRVDLKYIEYDSRDPDDPNIIYEKPVMLSASVDVSDMAGTMQNAQALLASVLGMSQSGTELSGQQKTASEVLTKARTMEISKYRTLDNASESIKQVCRVILELMPTIYDTERLMPIIDQKTGNVINEQINLADLNIVSDEYEVDITLSPMSQSLQTEKLGKMLAIMSVLPPEQQAKYEKKLVEMSDVLDKSEFDLMFGEAGSEQDPEAVQALQQADQEISNRDAIIAKKEADLSQVRLYVQQLQQEQSASNAIAQSNIVVEQIRARNKLEVEALKQQGSMNEAQLKVLADAKQAEDDSVLELQKLQMEIANRPEQVIEGAPPRMNAIDGQRNDLFK